MLKGIFTSRKWWAAFLALLGLVAAVSVGDMKLATAIQDAIGIVMAYILGTGIATAVRR